MTVKPKLSGSLNHQMEETQNINPHREEDNIQNEDYLTWIVK